MKNSLLYLVLFFLTLNLSAQDITSDLKAYIPFDGDASDKVVNAEGTYDATYVSFADGKFGQAAQFTASDKPGSYVVYKESDFNLPMGNDAYSISLWMKSDALDGLGMLVTWGVNGVTSGTNDQCVQLCASSDGYIRSGLWGNDYDVYTEVVNSGEWVHIVTTVASGTCSVYINGALESSGSLVNFAEPDIQTNPYDMWAIGALNSPQDNFGAWSPYNGYIDDVRIYGRGLTADDVAALYAYDPSSSNGIEEKTVQQLETYPNPVIDILKLKNTDQFSKVEIYALTGQLMKSSYTSESEIVQIEVSDLATGVYVLKAYSDDSSVSISKFIKQ